MTDLLKQKIRHVPDFPKAGILFYDITTLLQDPQGFTRRDRQPGRARFRARASTSSSASRAAGSSSDRPSPIASAPGSSPVRKPGKLPSTTVKASYELEYGTDSLEIHDDAVTKGQRVLIVDDLLATGGTARATLDLVTGLGGDVHALAFLIELVALNGRERLTGQTLHTVLKY